MPVYEYCCAECSWRFEQYREVEERSSCPCPRCGKLARKVFRPGAVIFKGPGFHSTDYRKPEDKVKAEAEAPKSEPAAAPKAGKAD